MFIVQNEYSENEYSGLTDKTCPIRKSVVLFVVITKNPFLQTILVVFVVVITKNPFLQTILVVFVVVITKNPFLQTILVVFVVVITKNPFLQTILVVIICCCYYEKSFLINNPCSYRLNKDKKYCN